MPVGNRFREDRAGKRTISVFTRSTHRVRADMAKAPLWTRAVRYWASSAGCDLETPDAPNLFRKSRGIAVRQAKACGRRGEFPVKMEGITIFIGLGNLLALHSLASAALKPAHRRASERSGKPP